MQNLLISRMPMTSETPEPISTSNIIVTFLFGFVGACLVIFDDRLTKLHIGPVFFLEFIFLAWLSFLIITKQARLYLKQSLVLWPFFLFLGWGLARVGIDLAFNREALKNSRDLMRFAQHALLFAYPVLWMTVGGWIARAVKSNFHSLNSRLALLSYPILAASMAPHLMGKLALNLSVGPLAAIVSFILLERTRRQPPSLFVPEKQRTQECLRSWIPAILGVLLTCFPFWSMLWESGISRTSLLLLFVILALMPFLRRTSFFQAMRILFIFGVTFITGALATPVIAYLSHHPLVHTYHYEPSKNQPEPQSAGDAIKFNLSRSFQKPDDVPTSDHPGNFQFRSRRFWWTDALLTWKEHWLIGAGFIPEVPRFILDDFKNDWETVARHPWLGVFSPIAGPHNSYLNILARTGIAGFLIFLFAMACFFKKALQLLRKKTGGGFNLAGCVVFILPFTGLAYAVFNVGLESPRNCFLLWICAGLIWQTAVRERFSAQ